MNDPLIDEIRRARREISNEVGPDLIGLVERYAKIESRFAKPALTAKDQKNKKVKKDTEREIESEPAYGSE